jgi:hypothetical protein
MRIHQDNARITVKREERGEREDPNVSKPFHHYFCCKYAGRSRKSFTTLKAFINLFR